MLFFNIKISLLDNTAASQNSPMYYTHRESNLAAMASYDLAQYYTVGRHFSPLCNTVARHILYCNTYIIDRDRGEKGMGNVREKKGDKEE
jgi:hypothetical protein